MFHFDVLTDERFVFDSYSKSRAREINGKKKNVYNVREK